MVMWHGSAGCPATGETGCKEGQFYSMQFGQAVAIKHVLAHKSFQLAPKPFLISSIDYNPCVIWIPPKNSTCQGKLRTKITSPMAKSTSPGLLDMTFFARWCGLKAVSGLSRGLLYITLINNDNILPYCDQFKRIFNNNNNDVKYIWNNSFLNCGCRWKWRMIIAINFPI